MEARCRIGRRLDMLVGPRFSFDGAWSQLIGNQLRRDGQTLVVELVPVSGPVFRVEDEGEYAARCDGCNEHSRFYKRRGEPALRGWAHAHRCATRG